MDGFETARRIKSQINLPRIPKIFMITAYGREEAMYQAKELGLDAFLVKPISRSILFDAIVETFSRERGKLAGGTPQAAEAEHLLTARVLVVEDNEINQQVALELLEGFGLTVEIAYNGKQATELLANANNRYDAVLMDLQMPEMDGYEATRIIRQTFNNTELPIIAMTAHALQTETKHCMEVGMNDYVPKPIEPEKLRSVLARWIKTRVPSTVAAGASSPEEIRRSLPGIDITTALKRLMGNRKLFDKLLHDFVQNYSDIASRIKEALNRGDLESAQRLVHTFKGVAGNLSATNVFNTAQNLESILRETDRTYLNEEINRLNAGMQVIVESVKNIPPPVTVAQPVATEPYLDIATLVRPIAELDKLLARNSLNARQQFSELKNKVSGQEFQELVMRLEDRINNLDFKEARNLLATLAQKLGITPVS